MTVPYLAHFALKDPPFSKEVADGELWLPASNQAVVDTLLEALDAGEVGAASRAPSCSMPRVRPLFTAHFEPARPDSHANDPTSNPTSNATTRDVLGRPETDKCEE
jgi:hypothetical protein